MGRPVLTLENEIVNYVTHCVSSTETTSTLKMIPSLVKRIIKDFGLLQSIRGKLSYLEQNDPDNEKISEFKEFVVNNEAELRQQYYIEEVKGT